MRLLTFLALASSFFFISCNDDDPIDDLPACVKEKFDTFKDEACSGGLIAGGGNLVKFRFRTEEVYCFNWGSSCAEGRERVIEIWSVDCDVICPLGGPAGLTSCDGVPWEGNAVELETIWQN